MTAPVRIVCVGAGYWGQNLVRTFHALGALAGICETDPARRSQVAAQYPGVTATDSLADLLPEVDAVAIATPAADHAAEVRQALLAGKDVFVEKPLCLAAAEGEALVALAAERGRLLMVGHLLRYHPAVIKLEELAAAGELGRLRYLYAHRTNLGKVRRAENALWSLAPHDLSVILALTGELPETVSAQGGHYLHDRVADVVTALLAFPSGTTAHLFASWLHPFKEQRLVVVGERQMAVFDDTAPQDKLLLYPHTVTWRGGLPEVERAAALAVPCGREEPLLAECRHFLHCLQRRETPRTDGREAVSVLRVLAACQNSLDRGAEPAGTAALPYYVHPSSYVDPDVTIGAGTSIWHFSHVLRHTAIGRDCHIGQNVMIGPHVSVGDGVKIQNNVSVYEGVTLEDHVFCGPSAVFTNVYNPRSEVRRLEQIRPTRVKQGATLGANCTVVCGVTIGRYAFIGAGAVVVRDVPDFALAVGNPARVIGWMCQCGHRIDCESPKGEGDCVVCGRRYQKDGDALSLL